MKTIKLLALAAMCMGSANAALYTVQTGTGAAINGFGNSAGLAFQGSSTTGFPAGSLSFGYFNISDAQITATTSLSTLFSSFVSFAGPGTFAVAGPIGQRGSVSVAGSGTVGSTGFEGKNIYALVVNATTLGAATEAAVLKTSTLFAASQDALPTPAVVTLNTTGTLLFGSSVSDLKTTNTDTSVNAGFLTAAPVPEPSAALLGAVGALGLLRRRRA